MLDALGAVPRRVRDPEDVRAVDGLIIPGGESTTIGLLLERFGTGEAIADAVAGGLPVFGTCAGAILLAKSIAGSDQYRLGLMDIAVERNAYGRQIESFEAAVPVSVLDGGAVQGVFIRAPVIANVSKSVEILARYESSPVVVRQDNCLAATFHPELTADDRLHRYFLSMVR